jgi:Family of unknown function (DUF6518)
MPERPAVTPGSTTRFANPASRSIRGLFVASGAGLAIGAVTSAGQGLLPETLAPLANSSASWCLCAFAIAMVEREPRRGALAGFVSLVAMLAGYAFATELRGYPVGATSMFVRWGAAAVVAGPALGVGAAWLRGSNGLRRAVGIAPIAGILLGEGLYGLTVVAATTPVSYWIGQVAVGLAVVVLAATRLRNGPLIALMLASSAVAGVILYAAYMLVLGAPI